jgi:hypothetical protein
LNVFTSRAEDTSATLSIVDFEIHTEDNVHEWQRSSSTY